MVGWIEHHFVHPALASLGLLAVACMLILTGLRRVPPDFNERIGDPAIRTLGRRLLRLRQLPRVAWLRVAVLLLLLLAIARPYWVEKTAKVPMALFLVDLSHSTEGAQTAMQEYIGRRIRQDLGSHGQFLIVGFAESPQVIQPWSEPSDVNLNRPIPTEAFTGRRDYTDIEQAVRFALTLLPPDSNERTGKPSLVLLTDGNENYGSLLQAAAPARQADANLEVVLLPVEKSHEIAAERLALPESLRVGEPLSAALTVHNYNPTFTEATARIRRDGRPVSDALTLGLYPGRNTFHLPLKPEFDHPGYYVFEAEVAPVVPGTDYFVENNKAGAVLRLEDKPRLYIVEAEPGTSRLLVQNAWAENFSNMRQTVAQALPTSVSQLMDYDGVVLYDVHARKLSSASQQALADYVREFGGGLIVLGGPDSFDYGNYPRSVLEDVLPVRSREPRDQPGPTGLLVLLIDFSGSMTDILDLVKRSANQTIDALPDGVTMDVLAFDARPQAQLEAVVLDAASRPQIKAAINGLSAGGGTDLWPALDKGLQRARAFLEKGKRRDHWARIIVYSDGKFDFDPVEFRRLINAYADYKIQVHCMAIGRKWEPNPLREVARFGHGRFEQYENRNGPAPFFAFEDPKTASEKKDYAPIRLPDDPILVGLPSAEPLPVTFSQYNRTQLKADGHLSCYIPGATGDSDPLLAWWHAGLGRVATFASDAGGLWSPALVQSALYRKLFLQTLIFTRRSARSNYCQIDAYPSPAQPGHVRLAVRTDAAELGPFQARVFFAPRPESPEQSRALALRPVKPGLFEAVWPAQEDLFNPGGAYAVVIKKQTPAGERFYADGKVYIPAAALARELMQGSPNQRLLARFAQDSRGVLLTVVHPLRPFPAVQKTRRHELLDGPARYLFGLIVLGLFLLDIARRTHNRQKSS